VGEIVEWIVGSSTNPSRPLALGPTLGLLGTLVGRHEAGPTGLRTNLYILALAASGYGKDHARKCISALAGESGFESFIGPEGFASDTALRKEIESRQALFCMIDEFGGFVGKIMDKRAGTHQSSIRQMLLSMFTSSGDVYRGSASAAERATPIFNPCLSLYGTSTPHDFWRSMTGVGVADGFLPRWLVLNVPGDPPEDVDPRVSMEPPHRLMEWCRALVTHTRRGNLADCMPGRVKAREAPWGAGGKEAYGDWRAYFRERAKESPPELEKLWSRAMEIGLKVAHITALGIDPEAPEVTGDLVSWGAQLARQSALSSITECQDRLASSDKQAEYLLVKRAIKEAGADGLAMPALKRAVNGLFDLRRFDDILKQLQESSEVELRICSGPRGGRPGPRLFAKWA
jgi:hypothetical protein